MLRARIDRGVYVWPCTVTDGESGGACANTGRRLMAAQPRTAATMIDRTVDISVSKAERVERIARDDGEVLLTVNGVRHRAVHDLTAEAGLPQHRAAAGVERIEVAFASTG